MIPELGNFALIVALIVALAQGTLPLLGAHLSRQPWVALARPAAVAQALLLAVAFACLTKTFIDNDFSVLYVAQHSNTLLPLQYRVAAVWGGHEGSLLLWVVMLAVWTLAVAARSRQLPEHMVARVLGVLGLVSAGFLLFILATSNPFERLLPGAEDGRDLNPLLQDPGLDHSPADALHGLCRLLGGLRFRRRRAARRTARRRLGALVAALDRSRHGCS
jgi:cytochrome c-type biogenesis protein CcmF